MGVNKQEAVLKDERRDEYCRAPVSIPSFRCYGGTPRGDGDDVHSPLVISVLISKMKRTTLKIRCIQT